MNTTQALRVSIARRGTVRFHDAIRRRDGFGGTGESDSTISISVPEVKVQELMRGQGPGRLANGIHGVVECRA